MGQPQQLEFTLQNRIPLVRGLLQAAASGLLPVLLSYVGRVFTPARFQLSSRDLLSVTIFFEAAALLTVLVQRTAREHVVVTPDGVVRKRRLLVGWTRRYDRDRISNVRYSPMWNELFTQVIGAAGYVEFDYGELSRGRLALARTDDEGREIAAQIDAVLEHPVIVTEADEFYSRG